MRIQNTKTAPDHRNARKALGTSLLLALAALLLQGCATANTKWALGTSSQSWPVTAGDHFVFEKNSPSQMTLVKCSF